MTNLILHGASSPASTLASAAAFDTLTGIKANVAHCHFPLQLGGKPLPFPIPLAQSFWANNQLFMATLGTWDLTTKVAWTAADVVAGKYDPLLIAAATSIANWQHPLFIRLDHEMNGTWAPWYSDGMSFAGLWRYIVNLFRGQGATNVTWVWCPNQVDPVGSSSTTAADKLPDYYPGPDYVDWLGFDAYNGATARNSKWMTWEQVAGLTYATLVKTISPSKPIFVGEWASHDAPGSKSLWIEDAIEAMPRIFPNIRGFAWFQKTDRGANWPLNIADAVEYAVGLHNGPYLTTPMSMPPDLQPIQPLQSTMSWGPTPPDPMLTAALEQHTLDQATIDTLHILAQASLEQIEAFDALRAHIRATNAAAELEP